MSGVGGAVFWGAVGLLVYTFVGFPLLLVLAAGVRRGGRVRKRDIEPPVSLIIAAYNEEASLAARLDNALALDYPVGRLEVVVASDGSTDATESIVSLYEPTRVHLLRLPRLGKIHALDEAVRHAAGSVLVFSDANTMMDTDALKALVANFADPAVGGVVGNTGYRPSPAAESSGRGESLYMRYDQWLKGLESRTGSVVSAHGGLYAIRRERYRKPERASVTDDFAISTAVVQQGDRLVFEREARAWEETAPRAEAEFRRRVRLMTRGLSGVALRRRLLNPFEHGFYSVVLFTHKVLRRLLPLTLPLLLISSALLATSSFLYQVALVGQLCFYALAAVGYLTRRARVGRWRLFYAPFYFCLANAAGLVALWKFATGQKIATWEPVRANGATASAQDARGTSALASGDAARGTAEGTALTDDACADPARVTTTGAFTLVDDARRPPAAVVIGLDSATGLQTARILKARGVPVIGVASDARHPCCRTRACERVVHADTWGPRLVEALIALGQSLGHKAVLFPCTDDSVLTVSRHRDEITPWMHLALPAPEVVELLIDKASFYTFASAAGFRVPTTFVLHDRKAAADAAVRLTYPCMLKPSLKTPAWKQSAGAKAFRVDWAGELLALYDRLAPLGLLIAQQWVNGRDTDHFTCNGYFGPDAEPFVTFTSRKLRQWPPDGGEGCLSEEVRNDDVRDETVRLFRQVQHRGLGYAELKRDALTGEYVILEPNICRPTGRSAQAEAAGVELMYTQYCHALGWPLPADREQSFRGVKWIHFRRDLQAGMHHWLRGELTLGDWARSWKGPKTDALFSLKDPVPFFADLTRVAFKRPRPHEPPSNKNPGASAA